MSEHLGVKGKIEYYHLPLGEEGGLTWCIHCKKTCRSMRVLIHQGICSYRLELECPKCKKIFLVAELENIKQEKLNKKCCICKKPTSQWNAHIISYGKNKEKYFCSEKCWRRLKERNC